MSEDKSKSRDVKVAEIQSRVGEWVLSNLAERQEFAQEIFDAMLPFIQTKVHYNQYLKTLTELTLTAAGVEKDNLAYPPGERPRLKRGGE